MKEEKKSPYTKKNPYTNHKLSSFQALFPLHRDTMVAITSPSPISFTLSLGQFHSPSLKKTHKKNPHYSKLL